MSQRPTLIAVLSWILLGGTGGLVRFISEVLKEDFPQLVTRRYVVIIVIRLVGNILISAFTGLIGALLVSDFVESITWQYVAASTFGYLGIEGMNQIVRVVRGRALPEK